MALPREAREPSHFKTLDSGLGENTSPEHQSVSTHAPKQVKLQFPITILEWPRNEREVVRVSLETFNGRNMIDVRTWWPDSEGSWKPARGGLTLSIKHLRPLAHGLSC
jgi:hypothetical protein